MAVDTTAKMAELELQTRRTYDAFCPFPISGCSVQLGLGSPDIGRMVSAKRGSSCAIVMNIILTCWTARHPLRQMNLPILQHRQSNDLTIGCSRAPTEEAVVAAASHLVIWRTTRSQSCVICRLKYSDGVKWLASIFQSAWQAGTILEDWLKDIILLFYKCKCNDSKHTVATIEELNNCAFQERPLHVSYWHSEGYLKGSE